MGRILVADDCPETRMLMEIVLEGAGHEVVAACDGLGIERALEAALADGSGFDALLLDYTMPEFKPSEFESKRKAQPALAATPVVYVTGHEVAHVRASVPGAGVLAKPISVNELLALIEELRAAIPRDPAVGAGT